MREHYRNESKEIYFRSKDYNLTEKEVESIKEFRKNRDNENIYYSVQDKELAVEVVDTDRILFHDLEHNKIYRSSWHQNLGMPIIAYYKDGNTIIYKSSLIYK